MVVKSKTARCPNCSTTMAISFEESCPTFVSWEFSCPDCGFPVLMELDLGQIKVEGDTCSEIIQDILNKLGRCR